MGERTKIDWADSTWNPVTGCLHECGYCYARRTARRFGRIEIGDFNGNTCDLKEPFRTAGGRINPYPYEFMPTIHRYRMDWPKKRKNPQNIFVCSMADLFGAWVPDEWIRSVFAACRDAPQHNYIFLTKNPKRYIELDGAGILPYGDDNFWFGTTVTDGNTEFFYSKSHNTFISAEPIQKPLGKLDPDWPPHPGWIIVGAETGNRKGKTVPERGWIESLLDECRKYGIPLFMKSSLAGIWGDPLIQEYPDGLKRGETPDFNNKL